MVAIAASVLISCSGGGSSVSTPAVKTGILVDAPVQGVAFVTDSGLTGTTDAAGTFSYREGETVAFRIGQLTLGSARGGPVISPLNLVPGAGTAGDPGVVRLLQALQTLDEDSDPSNGITISSATAGAFTAARHFSTVTNVQTEVIDVAFTGGGARTLVDYNTALLNFASGLSTAADNAADNTLAQALMAQMGTISNFVIGGGTRTCDSYNGAGTPTPTSNCSASWQDILANDITFSGMTGSDVSFTSGYPTPAITYTMTQPRIAAFAALPAAVLSQSTRDLVANALTTRFGGGTGANITAVSWGLFDGGNPLYADGAALWNNDLSNNDFDTLIGSFCGTVSPVNGTLAVLNTANFSAYDAAPVDSDANRQKAKVVLHRIVADIPVAATTGIYYRRNLSGTTASPNFRAQFQSYTGASALAQDGTTWAAGITNGLTDSEVTAVRVSFTDDVPGYTR